MARLVVAMAEEDRKVLDDLPTLVAASRRREAEDVQDQLATVHRVVSSVVRLIIGHVTVQRWLMVPPKKRNLGAYACGAWTCSTPDSFRGEKCSNQLDDTMCFNLLCDASNHLDDSMCFDLQCGAAISPVQDDDECEDHAAFLVESEGFGVLDTGATTSFGSVEGAEALFSKIHENDTRIPDVQPCGGRSLNLGDGVSSKAISLSRLSVRNEPLGDFRVPLHMFSDQPKPTPLMLGMDFLKEHRCVVNYGEDLKEFPMQSGCWWPLFVSSRGLYSMPLCGQHWEPSLQTQ